MLFNKKYKEKIETLEKELEKSKKNEEIAVNSATKFAKQVVKLRQELNELKKTQQPAKKAPKKTSVKEKKA